MTPLLIVEDEDLVADTMHRWLNNLGYPVSHARTAEEALALTRSGQPGVAICDVGLPGPHDGLWLVDQLRRDHPDVAVVLATGQDLPASAVRREGVVSCLLKPFGRDQLREVVTSAVRWHEEAVAGRDLELLLERAARECRRGLRRCLQAVRIESEADAQAALKLVFPDDSLIAGGARAAAMADAIAHHFAMPAPDRAALHWAARFSGLCRLVLPDAITRKPASLSAVEVAIVQRAPSDVFEMLLDHPFLSHAGYLLRSLRERQDGRGHPDGLAGPAIPLGSRILAVADAIEAIAHDQPHRLGRSPADTVLELLRCAGTQFDADVVHAAVQVIATTGAAYGDPTMTPVLIVEDEDLVAKTIGRWLDGCGYELAYATTAQEAVAAAGTAPVSVAVIDVGLPGEHDGLWVVEQLRLDHPGTAVVLATGRDYLPASATMGPGVVSYLLKPYGRDQLRAAVAEAVRWHAQAAPAAAIQLS